MRKHEVQDKFIDLATKYDKKSYNGCIYFDDVLSDLLKDYKVWVHNEIMGMHTEHRLHVRSIGILNEATKKQIIEILNEAQSTMDYILKNHYYTPTTKRRSKHAM